MGLTVEFDRRSPEHLIDQIPYILQPSPPGPFPWNTSQDSFYASYNSLNIDSVMEVLSSYMRSFTFPLSKMSVIEQLKYVSVGTILYYMLMKRLAERSDRDITAYGLEAGLNRILEDIHLMATRYTNCVVRPLSSCGSQNPEITSTWGDWEFFYSELRSLVKGHIVTTSIDETSQQPFQEHKDTIILGNAPCDENKWYVYFEWITTSYELAYYELVRQNIKEIRGLKITSTLPEESLFQYCGSQSCNGIKNQIVEQCLPKLSTSQFQEKEKLLITNTQNITQQPYPHLIGSDFGGDSQYDVRNSLIKDVTDLVNEPRDAQIDRYMIVKSTSRCLLEGQGQRSIAPQSCEIEADDLENNLEEGPLVDQHTQYCNESSRFVDGESYHQVFEMGPNGTNLHRDVESDGNGKKEITHEAILKLWSTNITLVAAAKKLGVSRSTLKRRCRAFGISGWRSSKRIIQDQSNQENPKTKPLSISESSQVNLENATVSGRRKRKSASESQSKPVSGSTSKGNSAHKKLTLTNTGGQDENTELQQTTYNGASRAIQDGTSTVFTVKAKYKEDTIKFNFSVTSSFDQLKEDVGSRLNLDSNNFKITYIDNDGDTVTITRDSDLQLFLNDMELSKTYNVRLFIVERN